MSTIKWSCEVKTVKTLSNKRYHYIRKCDVWCRVKIEEYNLICDDSTTANSFFTTIKRNGSIHHSKILCGEHFKTN